MSRLERNLCYSFIDLPQTWEDNDVIGGATLAWRSKSSSAKGLLKDGTELQWTNLEEDAFKQLSNRLTSAPIWILPDYSKEFVVHTDASLSAIGGAIMQEDKEGH
uniref:RT_RNaseH_2 domain-containing protein n=1 Tax=Panagrellus redivivus TaxID=6233 RepID=A0A7E4V8X3_PANRE